MKIVSHGLVLFILLLSGFSLGLTLQEAQNLALENNKELQSVKYTIASNEYACRETQALFQPQVSSYASYAYLTETSRMKLSMPVGNIPITIDKALGDHDKTEFGVDMSYALFTGGARKNLLENRKHALEAEKYNYSALKNRLLFTLGIVYIQWKQAYDRIALYETSCKLFSEERSRVQALFENGVAVKADIARADAVLANADFEKRGAIAKADSLKYELCAILGVDEASITPAEYDIGFLREKIGSPFNDERFEVQQLDEMISQFSFTQKALFGERLPTLLTFAGLRIANPGLNLTADEFMTYGQFGLRLNWTLYDGFANRMKRNQINSQISFIEKKREFAIHQWKMKKEQSALMLENITAMKEAAAKALQAATEYCENVKYGIDAGTVVSDDYLKAVLEQEKAALQIQQAEALRNATALQLLYAAGYEIDYNGK